MRRRPLSVYIILAASTLLGVAIAGCGDDAGTARENAGATAEGVREGVEGVVAEIEQRAGYALEMAELVTSSCEDIITRSVREGEGYGVPGVSGAARWGIPETAPATTRVRRSWSTLSDAEKKQVADGFIKLKQTTVGSGAPGAERAVYQSFCEGDGSYTHNLHDYYVELHSSAYVSMGRDDQSMSQMPHMGPQFLPWHRYLLLRIEADLAEVLGDPDFALPYWDWEDCGAGTDDGSNPCPELFETDFLGSHGSCDEEGIEVTGYLVDQGFVTHLWSQVDVDNFFNTDGLQCSTKPLQRQVGCDAQGVVDRRAANAEEFAAVFDREVYDTEPYDSCNTDEDVSMRQYVEGFRASDRHAICIIGGCQTHGRGHLYIGGDMGGQSVSNDPVFFLHHANVDRMWAMWQDENRQSADTAVDYGNPGYPDDWRGAIFNFSEVRADEMFDFRALGFTYDTNEE